jgi:hypothetical protein
VDALRHAVHMHDLERHDTPKHDDLFLFEPHKWVIIIDLRRKEQSAS